MEIVRFQVKKLPKVHNILETQKLKLLPKRRETYLELQLRNALTVMICVCNINYFRFV